MTHADVFSKVTSIILSFAPDADTGKVTESTNIVDELGVSSARFVDIVLELEDQFRITIDDSNMDKIVTIGDAVNLVVSLVPADAVSA